MLPRAAPVALVARSPIRVPERLLHLHPHAVLLLLTLHIAHEDVQLLPRLVKLRVVRPLRAGLRPPQRVRAAEQHPALLGRREVGDIDRAVNLVRLEEGFLRHEPLRLRLLGGVVRGWFSGGAGEEERKQRGDGKQRFHVGRLDGMVQKTLPKWIGSPLKWEGALSSAHRLRVRTFETSVLSSTRNRAGCNATGSSAGKTGASW